MLTEEQTAQIQQRVLTKGKIAGIKLYMEFSGATLVESKKQVEQLLKAGELGESGNPIGNDFDLDNALMDSILNAIQDGNKIEAVKLYRDATGNSLRPSKEFIEKLMDELALSDPNAVGKTGCLLIWIALAATVGLLI